MPADERPDLRVTAQQDYPELRDPELRGEPVKPAKTWKRRVEVKAPLPAWQRLGRLLELRRRTLGYTWRTDFERERRVNRRLAADIEKAAPGRVNTFTNGSLGLVAQGYAVDYESMLAVLRGEADELVPVPVAPVNPDLIPVPAGPAVLPAADPPFADPARGSSDRPYFDAINRQRLALAARGVTEPTGAQMFGEGTDDAQVWDGLARGFDIDDVAWIMADLARRAADRRGGPNAGTGTNGSLCRGYFAAQRLMSGLSAGARVSIVYNDA